jgi:large subunit ribosomal protein L24
MARLPKIAKGDTVVVRRGKEKGKSGVVRIVSPKEGRATVEGLNIVKRHTKQGQGGAKAAGILEKEASIPLCALMVLDPKTKLPTRVRRIRRADGSSVRVAVRSGEELAAPTKAGLA